jgi:hypothetical protein
MSSEIPSPATGEPLTQNELIQKASEILSPEEVSAMNSVLVWIPEQFRYSPSSIQIILGYLQRAEASKETEQEKNAYHAMINFVMKRKGS